MKLLLTLLVSGSTMFLGIYAAKLGDVGNILLALPKIELSVFGPAEPKAIDITYLGFRSEAQDVGTVSLILLVTNRTNEPLIYVGNSRGHSFPLIKADGETLPRAFVCSRGSSEYTIQPGGSAKLYVAREEFLVDTPDGSAITVGFNLRFGPEKGAVAYFSEPFLLPEGFLLKTNSR